MSPRSAQQDAAQACDDYLTVSLDDDVFALRIAAVHEVLDPPAMTIVPNAPDFAPGLINVRGNVVPLIDLRIRFGMGAEDDTEHSRVIVSRVQVNGEGFYVGIKADAVHEVIQVRNETIESLPENGTRWPQQFLGGVVRHNGRFVILLDIDRILQTADTALN